MKVLKWIGYILGGLIVVLAIALGIFYFISEQKLGNNYMITPDPITIPTDAASIEHGKHLVEAVGECVGCHTPNLAGQMFIDDPNFARLAAPNLTNGQGGINYSDQDWVRALRYGIGSDGRQLIIMPSHWYSYMNDEDLGAMVAYLKTVPPVDQAWPERSFSLIPGSILISLGAIPFAPELIAQNGPRTSPAPAVTAEYGEYLTNIAACRECHGSNLAGNTSEGAPMGPNLTPGGAFAAYREEDFLKVMRTGVTPGGRTLSEEMPWVNYGKMTDEELQAIFTYLRTVEPLPNAGL